MQTSAKPLQQEKEQRIITQLATLLADLNNPIEAEQFLRDFLTTTELSVLAKRLAIFQMLKNGASYQEIQNKLKVSSATVSSVADFRLSLGSRIAENKLYADEWAHALSERISHYLPSFLKGGRS